MVGMYRPDNAGRFRVLNAVRGCQSGCNIATPCFDWQITRTCSSTYAARSCSTHAIYRYAQISNACDIKWLLSPYGCS